MNDRIDGGGEGEGDHGRQLAAALARLSAAVDRLEHAAAASRDRAAALADTSDEAVALRAAQHQLAGRLDAALDRLRGALDG